MRVFSRDGLPTRILAATLSAILAFGGWPAPGLQVLAGASVAYAEEDQAAEDLVLDLSDDLILDEESATDEVEPIKDNASEVVVPADEPEVIADDDANDTEVTGVVGQDEEAVAEEAPASDAAEVAAPDVEQEPADAETAADVATDDPEPELSAQMSTPDDRPQVHLDRDYADFYNDGDLVLHYTKDEGIGSGYYVTVELGVFHMSNEIDGYFDPDFSDERGTAYTFDSGQQEIVLKGEWLWNNYFKDHQDEDLRVSVWLMDSNGEQVHPYNPEHGYYHLREARVDYHLPGDMAMLTGWTNRIDRDQLAWAENAAHPGEDVPYFVTDVAVVEHPDEGVSQVIDLHEDYRCWFWQAKGHGTADFTVTYTTIDGETATHTFTVSVGGAVNEVHAGITGNINTNDANGSNRGLPGQSIWLWAAGVQHDEEAGDLRFGFTYDWEIVRGSDYASITWQMQDDGSSGATVTFNDYTGDDFLNEEVVVRVTATKDGMSATSNDLYLFVSNEYPEVWIQETDSINIVNLLLGDSRQVTPEVRYFKQAGDEAYEACELESVRWDFDEDCVNITDAGGNLVASGDECEPGTFTITRLGDWDSDIDLEASWRPTADQQPDVADSEGLRHEHTRFHLDHYDANLFFEGDIPDEFFVRDDTDSLTLTVNRQNVSDLAYLDWTVGLCVEDDWVEDHIFTEGVEYTAQGNTITLNGAEILDHMGGYGEGEEYVHVRVFVEAKLPDSSMPNPVIANATTWVNFREPFEEYNLPWNRDMLVGWEDTVFRWYDGQICNEEHPGIDRVNCEVTDVAVLGENPDEGYSKVLEVRREEWEDSEGALDHNWRYRAVGHGFATVQVTYVTQSGETRTHEISVRVSGDLYDLRVWSGDWADCVLPGTTVDLYAEAVHHREGQEDTTEGLNVDWRLIEGAQVGELTIDPNDPNHAIFTVSTNKLHYDDHVNVRAYLYDGISGPMAENSWMFQVRDEYLELWPTHIDENLALGAEQDIDVELRHYSWGNFTNGYEVVEGARYELAEVDPNQVIIADAAGNYLSDGEIQPGTYTVMRQGRNDTSFTLRCWYNDDNNHTQYFDHWYDLHGRNYNLWFENVPDRVVVDDEHPTTTLALNTQDFEGVQDVVYNITVGTWENDQWVDILQPGTDYAVEDNEIILNSASILERFDTHEMRLRATAEATWQGQQLHETDCWFTLLEPYAEYWKQEDRDVLPGWDGTVDDFGWVWVCDADHPDGYDALYEVTDVQVIAGEEHLEDFHEDSNEYASWWYYRAKDFGTVTFEVTYRDLDGVEQSYTFDLNIVGTVYNVDFSASESGEHLLPGSTVEVWAHAVRHTAVQRTDDQGNTWYDDEVTTDNLGYAWEKTEGEDLFEIVQDASDPSHITVQVNDLPDRWQDLYRTIVMRVNVLDDDEAVISRRWAYEVSTDFVEVFPTEIDGNLAPGASQNVNLELRHYTYEQGGYTTVDDASFYFWFDDDCVSITDSQGAAVVDNGDVPASEPEVGYPAGNFVITRTGNGDTEINIRGAWAEGSNTQEVWRRWHLNHLDYDMGFDGPHDLLVWALGGFESYSSLVDTTQELTLNENLAEVDGLTIEYTVGIWDKDEFVKTFGTDSGLYTVSDDGLSITSNAAAMAEQDISDLRVIAQAKLGDTVLCESHNDFWFHLRRAEEHYDLNRDESMIIGWWNRIDRQRDAFVRNPDYPDGAHVPFQITNVEVEQHPVRSVERVIDLKKVYENDDETSENYWWEYWAVGYGSAELEVTYIDVSGATRTHKFSVSVTADVYNVDVWADGSGMTMPGGSVTLQAEGIHHRDYGEDTQENLTYQWEIDQDLIEQGICQLVVDENDPSRATVTFAATPDHGAQLYWREAWVTVHLIDEGFEFAENTINVICCSDYEEVWPAILDRNLDVNQSITVTPEVRHYCASFLEEDDAHEYEVVEGATFSWDYDENAFNVVDNGAGSYTITRLAHWPVQLRLFAEWTDGDGNHRHEDRTYPMNYLGEPSSLNNATFSEIPDQTYTGSTLTPAVTLTDGDKTLVEGTDYTLAYDANINAGTATVTATGKGNYQGTVSTTFTILPKSLEDATVTIGNKYYTGNEVTPVPTVKDGETALVKDTDFTVTYINNVKVGKATATITGTGNYTGEVTKYFKVVGQVSKVTVSAVANQTYTGKAITPAPTVKFGNTTLKNGTHYTLTYANNTKPGEASITIKGKGYYNGTKTVTFKITAPITKATVSSVKNQAYTGKEIKPSPTIKFAGATLKKGTDYTLTYKDNKKAGTATITIKGKGFYTGSRTVTFKITATGTWKKSGSKWWYCYTNGDYPYSQFLDIDGCRYYFDKNGYMVTGWQQIGSDWYYFRSDGKMAGGWFKSGSSWYYLIPSGADAGKMAVGWHKIDGKYYYFYSSGVMAVNTKIGNYTVGADGARK